MPTPYRFSETWRRFVFLILCGLFTWALADANVLADEPTPKPAAQAAPSDAAGPPTVLVLRVALEDGAKIPLSLKLRGIYDETLKTWENVQPGEVRLEAPKLAPESYKLLVTAKGHIVRHLPVRVSIHGVQVTPDTVEVPRLRYAVLSYDVNVKGKPELTGDDVRHFRVAVTNLGSLPELRGDFLIRQDRGADGKNLTINFLNVGPQHGLAVVPAGKTYDELDAAPPPNDYKCEDVVCKKGMLLFTHLQGHGPGTERYAKIFIEDVTETPPKDAQLIASADVWKDQKHEAVVPRTAGLSGEQLTATKEDLRVAMEKMDQLTADEPKIARTTLRRMAHEQLIRFQEEYNQGSQSNPVAAAKRYRERVEGKTIYDFAGPSSRPEYIVAAAARSKEWNRLNEEVARVDAAHKTEYRAALLGVQAEAFRRFPRDELASMNWFVDHVRGKRPEDLPEALVSARAEPLAPAPLPAGTSPAGTLPTRKLLASEILTFAAGKQIDLPQALAAIKASEAKVKNAQWHIVYSNGTLERKHDPSSYKSLPLTRTEGNIVYDYETDRYRVELSGVREWPKNAGQQATPLLEWAHVYAYDGAALRVLQIDGPPNWNSPQAFVARNAASYEGRNEVQHAVTTQAAAMYFLNGAPYEEKAVPVPRLSKQLEMNSKAGRQLKVTARDNGVWVIADSSVPFQLAYDPRKGAILGAQFAATLYPTDIANPTQLASAKPNELPQSPIELTGVLKIELQQVGEFWPPKTVTRANFRNGDAAQRFEFSDVKINQPIPPEAFALEIPSGTHVIDRVAKTSYMVASPAEPSAPAASLEPVASVNLSPTPIADAQPATQWGPISWIALVLGGLAALLLIGIVVMRRRARV